MALSIDELPNGVESLKALATYQLLKPCAAWAIIALTCKLNGVNPHASLSGTLTKFVNRWPISRIDELMPCVYARIGA